MSNNIVALLTMNLDHFKNAKCISFADRMMPSKNMKEDVNFAKAVCKECEHKSECLELALTFDAQGVWGGTSEEDRRDMRWEKGAK